MSDKSYFETTMRDGLKLKAEEARSTDQMFMDIAKRIEIYKGGDQRMVRLRMSNSFMKKCIAASICGVLMLSGVSFTFSAEVRAATMDVINKIITVFVVEKDNGKYTLVEKTRVDEEFLPIISNGTELSDEDLTKKVGFRVKFPLLLQKKYVLHDKGNAVGVTKKISADEMLKIEDDLFKAVNDDSIFDSLIDYNPYRSVFGTYTDNAGNSVHISMMPSTVLTTKLNDNALKEIKVGETNGAWFEVAYPDYPLIIENNIGKADMSKKPTGIVTRKSLAWEANGIKYQLSTVGYDLTMEQAVEFAEAFMAGQNNPQ